MSFENHKILSNRLGEPKIEPVVVSNRIVYNHSATRNIAQIKWNKTYRFEKFNTGGGLNLLLSDAYKTQVTGGFCVSLTTPNIGHIISMSALPTACLLLPICTTKAPKTQETPAYNQKLPLPTKPAANFSKQNTRISLAVFERDMKNTIDWT